MTDVERGLSAREVEERVADGRVNRVDSGTERSLLGILRANVLTPVNAIMVVRTFWFWEPSQAL